MTATLRPGPRRLARLGLRARVTVAFALGGLILSVTLALATLALTRQSLVAEREDTAFAVAISNGRRVRNQLTPDIDEQGLTRVIESLATADGSFPLLRFGDTWIARDPQTFNQDDVPGELLALTSADQAARIRTTLRGRPAIVTGLPIPNFDATYFEALLLDDVESTLSSLALIVFSVAAATTLLSAFLGIWASRRTLAPLGEVRAAAESLAAGELDTRLDPPADADLAALVASFNEMARALEDRIERDARFASAVSHELRSPLMTLTASLEVLRNSYDELPPRSQTALDLLDADISRFQQLVQDLLEISRYDVGTAALDAEPVLLSEFVRQAVAHSTAPDARVIVTDTAEDLVVLADKRRLAQVLANLLDNATKYGAPPVTITLDAEAGPGGGIYRIVVEDHGPGIPADERLRVFDRFSRGAAGGRRGVDTGTGLGLSLVAEHVGLHGGRIWTEPRPDGLSGARFVIELPVGETSDRDDTP